jgi:crossover junction endodeoxyribonuclease RuvC
MIQIKSIIFNIGKEKIIFDLIVILKYNQLMRILGIDPGYGIVGFGVVDYINSEYKVVDYGVIETSKEESMPARLALVYKGIKSLIEEYKPDEMAVEQLFFFKNHTTVIPVAEARGVVLLAGIDNCGEIFEYTPLQIKQALTGNGRAEKKQVQYMVKAILGLQNIPRPDDAADALAVAICHANFNQVIR